MGSPPTPCQTVLVVDDDPMVGAAVGRGLKLLGLQAAVAASGPEAVELVRAGLAPAFAILDVSLPLIDGPAILAALRTVRPGLRCCFMTGGSTDYSAADLLAAGAENVLSKPFALAELAAVLPVDLTESAALRAGSAGRSGGFGPAPPVLPQLPTCGVLRCDVCGRTTAATDTELQGFAHDGWPKCCGEVMALSLPALKHPAAHRRG
jgi:CheY-like chemotaxis protein